jgi:serine/threonine-protein kinase
MSALQTLGKHEIRRQLGRGAMGVVYEGWDPVIKRRVAIKTVPLPAATDDQTAGEIARFRREAEAAGRLNHPNIVGVFDYGETNDVAYIVMEFVDGPTLKALLDRHERFPLPRIAQIMEDLLSGLQFSHEHGVVHRDIKPANLMLTTSGRAKIADFGIARIESSSMTQAGTVLGTPAYMAPEQFMGEVVDARSDIYSAGVLFFQLLTGERPFEGSMSSIMHKALHTEAPSPSQISVTTPRQFDTVIRRAMAKRPDDRFPSAKEFATAIREALAESAPRPKVELPAVRDDSTIVAARGAKPRAPEPPAAPPRPAAPPPIRGAAAWPKTGFASPGVIGGGVAGLAVLGGLGYFLLSGSSPSRLPEPARRVMVSAPQPTAAVTPAPPDPPRAEAMSEPATPPAVNQPAVAPPVVALAAPPTPPPDASQTATTAPPPASQPAIVPPVVALAPTPAPPPDVSQAPTVPPPATPASSQRALSPLDQARAAARAVPCSALNVAGEFYVSRISGLAHSGPELDRLLADARARGQPTDDVSVSERFSCTLIDTVSMAARPTWESAPRELSVSLDRPDPVSGARLGIDVSTTLPALYVDLYQGGLVHHLVRPSSTGAANNPHAISAVAPAAGPGLIFAIGSATPFDLGERPETEKALGYLAALRPLLRNAAPPPAADIAMVTARPPEPPAPPVRPIETVVAKPVEPPAAKPRPVEPAAAKAPPPHPAALRSSRCSNIVSRAQLGETLSNAELTVLRTECRS